MKFALVLLAVCGTQQCPKPSHPEETKLYSSFHACWLDLVPKIYYSRGKWKCVQRAHPAAVKPTQSHVALPPNDSEIVSLLRMESGGDAELVNRFGYAGLFQFGAPLLTDLGLYTPGPKEDLSTWSKTGRAAPGKWSGTFSIPGFPSVRTLSNFLENRGAQLAAFSFDRARMEQQIERRGLEDYVDHEIGGTNITRTGLVYMIHLGGPAGAQRVLQTRGRTNPKDANGTTLLDYARVGAKNRAPELVKIGQSENVVAGPSTSEQVSRPAEPCRPVLFRCSPFGSKLGLKHGRPKVRGVDMEDEAEKRSGPPDRSAIYVDDSVPAALSYSETSVNYRTLREAITTWLALRPEVKKDASITTGESGGTCYRGWEIYRLWGR